MELDLLQSWRRPIVLLRKRREAAIAEAVAPGNPFRGVLLPYTPLHHLLVQEMRGIPLILTSGNRSDEPIACEDADALERLANIADLFLIHDRPIAVRCDDSVTRIVDGNELPVRRSRGYAPEPTALPFTCPEPVLAVGGQLKATFALGRGRNAFLSHHLGDLDHYDAFAAFVKDIGLYRNLFDIEPTIIAHDAHPDYASTGYVRGRGDQVRVLAVQHHHAHLVSCMVENGLTETVIGVILDGSGYGDDGTIWGGEFLVGDYRRYQRAGHLRPVGMPGGEAAIREPWRMTLAHLVDAGIDCPTWSNRIPPLALRTAIRLHEQRFNCPRTSSMGRLFDAVASLIGVRDRVHFEGQAAMQLEWLATGVSPEGAYSFDLSEGSPLEFDTRPLIHEVVQAVQRGTDTERMARRFHSTLVAMIGQACERVRRTTGLEAVVLSGGVFQNALLTCEASACLTREGFRVYRHRLVPPGDGGLSLGQLATAAHSIG